MNIQYGFHIWFKVCKPFRIKYSLSTNCILVLNGAHLYNTILNKPFTRYNLLKFVSYYDNSRIGKYITVLVEHGFIIPDGLYRNHQMYCISGKGKQVIQELNESYNSELIKFCSLYNIEV